MHIGTSGGFSVVSPLGLLKKLMLKTGVGAVDTSDAAVFGCPNKLMLNVGAVEVEEVFFEKGVSATLKIGGSFEAPLDIPNRPTLDDAGAEVFWLGEALRGDSHAGHLFRHWLTSTSQTWQFHLPWFMEAHNFWRAFGASVEFSVIL